MKTSSRTAGPVETKIKGFQNPKPRIEGGSTAASRPSTPLSLSVGLYGPVLAVKGSASPRFAPWTAPGPGLGDSLFMREKGELQRRGSPPRTGRAFQWVRRREKVLQGERWMAGKVSDRAVMRGTSSFII